MWTSPGTWPSQLLWNKEGPKGPFLSYLKFNTEDIFIFLLHYF